MTLDERIQRLMELLAQVKLRGTNPRSSMPPPPEEPPPPFDAEATVVDDPPSSPSLPATPRAIPLNGTRAPTAPSAPALPSPPESAPRESLSRLIAAQRSDVDYDPDDEQTAPGFDRTQEMRHAPSFTGEVRAMRPPASSPELEVTGSVDLDSDIDLHERAKAEDEERSPASSRRPVLPDDVAPALPDLGWDGMSDVGSLDDAPPESGPHVASSGIELDPRHDDAESDDESDVTGVRSAASLAPADAPPPASASGPKTASPAPAPSAASAAHVSTVAAFVGAVRTFKPVTFGEMIDATLEL